MSQHQQNFLDSARHVVSDPRKRLESRLKQSGNDVCADCRTPDPKWVSTNLGVFICIKCSGVHRNLGVHISKVVSVNLDEWTDELVDSLVGNDAANQKYEACIPENLKKPDSESSIETRHDFIWRKYELQQFSSSSTDMSVPDPSPPVLADPACEKKHQHSLSGNGLRQAFRNSLKWKEAEQMTVPKKSNSTAGMVEFVGLVKVNVVRGTNLATRDLLRMTSDPYVILSLGEQVRFTLIFCRTNSSFCCPVKTDENMFNFLGAWKYFQTVRTNIIRNNLNPVWNQSLMLSIPEHIPPLKLAVYDKDTFSSDDYMGEAEIDIAPMFLAAKANEKSKTDESAQLEEQVAGQDNVTRLSVMLQNVERGVVDIELEFIPLTQ